MKILFSPFSPYVRKCLVTAHELGLGDRVQLLPSNAHPVQRDREIIVNNPLGKVPTFFTDDGQVLYDSRVICEYLNALGNGSLFPAEAAQRWTTLTEQALGDGILDAALLARYEGAMRPEPLRWADWSAGQIDKIRTGVAAIDARADGFGARVDIGTITFGCVLGYLDLRFPDLDWRAGNGRAAQWFERFNARPSMQATLPRA